MWYATSAYGKKKPPSEGRHSLSEKALNRGCVRELFRQTQDCFFKAEDLPRLASRWMSSSEFERQAFRVASDASRALRVAYKNWRRP
jgi:hypothetical protein